VAYTAVHNVLEMIAPQYIKLKMDEKMTHDNSLGIICFQSLLLMGYWKKTVYLMDAENSLAVTQTFADFKNFKNIYL
jgi:hypothetical protein